MPVLNSYLQGLIVYLSLEIVYCTSSSNNNAASAAATGTASIVFNNYRPETVLNDKTGFIVKDVEEMMDKLAILIEDADLRSEMGKRAREYAKRFDWKIMLKPVADRMSAVRKA